jgi:Spy/CpxP family protein refolding chaperone
MNRIAHSKRKRAAQAAATAALVLLSWGGMPAAAQPGPGPGAGPGDGRGERRIERRILRAPAMHRERARASWDRLLAAADELNLSATQRDRLRAIRRSAPAALMPKRQAIAEARLDLADLMERKDAGAAELRQAHERLVQARGALANAAFDLRMQAREVLTSQQREKLETEMRERKRDARERRRGRDLRRGELAPERDPAAGELSLAPPAPPFDYDPEFGFEVDIELDEVVDE